MNTFGDKIKISIFGQSHSKAIGVTIDGLEAGIQIDEDKLCAFMKRRSAVGKDYATPRKEEDKVEFVSGLVNGKTVGTSLTAVIYNNDVRSKDYSELAITPRPSHADFPAVCKFGEDYDVRGSGQFSGRMTAPLCIAGGIFMQLLEQKGIFIGSHVQSIFNVEDEKFDLCNVNKDVLESVKNKNFPVIDDKKGQKMIEVILDAAKQNDSVGGIVECAVVGIGVGVGTPMFCGLENIISKCVFSVPAVKAIEFGNGFECAKLYGSQNNDAYCIKDGKVVTKTNNSGGICAGMSTGMPLVFRVAIKPTPSISKEQDTVNLKTMENAKLCVHGRHDPCIVPRAAVCIESACAIALSQICL